MATKFPKKSTINQQAPWLPYVAPFLLFIIITELANWLPSVLSPWLYLAKTLLTAGVLWLFYEKYAEELQSSLTARQWLTALCCGLLVLFIWIGGESWLPRIDATSSFAENIGETTSGAAAFFLFVRLLGSSLVVPLMEELFWRSFLMRYLIEKNFRNIPVGSFSWFSFIATAVLFGLEHNRIVAGVLAGLFYGGLVAWQKNLRGAVIAHTVTNFGLGIYVIVTKSWWFW